MRDVPENELFSAYLDGELTAGEQADVEQLLASSQAARQLVDDLRALRARLQALPSHTIGTDISGEVLRRAREATGAADERSQPRTDELPQPAGPFWKTVARRVLQPRALVWSGLAVSVAILLLVTESMRQDDARHPPIAMHTKAERETADRGPSISASSRAADEMFEMDATLEESLADSAYRRSSTAGSDSKAGESAAELADARGTAPAATPPETTLPERTLEVSTQTKAPDTADLAKGVAETHDVAEGAGMGSRLKGGRRDESAPFAKPTFQNGFAGMFKGKGAGAPEGPGSAQTAESLPSGVTVQQAEPAVSLVTLTCNVTTEAAKQQVFEKLLKQQQIVMHQRAAAPGARDAAGERYGYAEREKAEFYLAAVNAENAICYDFEVTRERLAGLLEDLKQRPKEFSPVLCLAGTGGISNELLGLTTGTEQLNPQVAEGLHFGAARLKKESEDYGKTTNGRWGGQGKLPSRGRDRDAADQPWADGQPRAPGPGASGKTFAGREETLQQRPLGRQDVQAKEAFRQRAALLDMSAEDREESDQIRREMEPQEEAAPSPPKKPTVSQPVPGEVDGQVQLQLEEDADKQAVTQPARRDRQGTQPARPAAPAAPTGEPKPDLGKRAEEREKRLPQLARAKDLDRLVAKYRVRFLLKIVDSDTAGMAAFAKPAAAKADVAADAEVEPPAEPAQAIQSPAVQAPESPKGEP